MIVRNPFSGEAITEVQVSSVEQAIESIQIAKKYFDVEFKFFPAYKRVAILEKVAELINQNLEELALLIAQEGGKPYKDAKVEVIRAVSTVKLAANECFHLDGEQIQMDKSAAGENVIAFTQREPVGVVLAISAFNHPVNLICHQVATAIAAGNVVILKPAEKTPLSAKKIVEFFYQAGLPEKALHYLLLTGKETQMIVSNPNLNYVSFIGNAEIGWMIRRLSAPGVKITLEHGGTGTAVLDQNADLSKAIPSIIRGAFYHSGQVCVSTQILYIHSEIYDKAIELLKNSTANLKVGDAILPDTDCGPLITDAVVEKMNFLVNDAKEKGGFIEIGGEKLPNQCFMPTLISNANSQMEGITEEVFGPLLFIKKYDNLDIVIKDINESKFSFQTSIYSKDIDIALRYAKLIDQKAVIINESTAFRVDWMPFGGKKLSGFGTGGVKYSILDMTEEKLIIIKNQF
jgi:acyl-CoA reductase-like NAD-dependent aldehyde dehydrogenase